MQVIDIYPTQEELNRLQPLLASATFDDECGRWVLSDGRAVPTCEGCPCRRPDVVRETSYPDPHGAPPNIVKHYLCHYHDK
ncbi:hypothetical protein [Nonomuraea sp. SYSU D8015]|uniref:hypothetical protein n=1 Tax=Nonomuraea sp. SYSU D8015 TaxID=2593644 RepID=UPI0016609DC6|nr:hypothetical protein [Nonomuraea sp. SYSU D8015]